jgi:hypothetical protein
MERKRSICAVKAQIPRFVVAIAVPIATGAATWVNPPPAAEMAQPAASMPARSEASVGSQGSGITVSRWQFSPAVPGRPVYLSMTLDGTQATIDRMQTGPLRIAVHWVRENAAATPGPPNLVTDLTIGRPDLAGALAGEVRRKGFFEWHSWVRKDAVGPGTWTVSLTYSDGQPLLCGQEAQPCRFTLNVG